MTTPEFLGNVPIFEHLTSEQLLPLGEKMRTRKYQRGEVVFHQDDPGDRMHIIVKGRVRISIDSDDGREKDVALLNPGDCFGEMALLDGSNRSANATAIDDIETLVLLRDDFNEFLGQYPRVAAQTTALLTNRLRNANQMMGDLAFLDVPTRVAKQLLELAESQMGGDASDGPTGGPQDGVIEIPIGQDELARLVGSTRETVSRALTSYRRMGLLTTSHRRISITDLDALERMASYLAQDCSPVWVIIALHGVEARSRWNRDAPTSNQGCDAPKRLYRTILGGHHGFGDRHSAHSTFGHGL